MEYFGEKFVTNVLINTVLNFGETATLGNEAFNVHDVHTSSRAEGVINYIYICTPSETTVVRFLARINKYSRLEV